MSDDTPELTDLHREYCDGTSHVAPIGFYASDPYEADDHGEAAHSGGSPEQCLCGHPLYYGCPDHIGADMLAYWNPDTTPSSPGVPLGQPGGSL